MRGSVQLLNKPEFPRAPARDISSPGPFEQLQLLVTVHLSVHGTDLYVHPRLTISRLVDQVRRWHKFSIASCLS